MLAAALLVLIPFTSLLWLCSWLLHESGRGVYYPEPWRCLAAVFAPFFMAVYGLRKKSLCLSGALAGLLVGFLLTLSSMCFFSALLAFFIGGSRATKFKSSMKQKIEDNYKEAMESLKAVRSQVYLVFIVLLQLGEIFSSYHQVSAWRFLVGGLYPRRGNGGVTGGQRDWKQVMCNGGVATWLAVLYLMQVGCVELPIDFSRHYEPSCLAMAIMGSLACCCGDTFASEFGSVMSVGSPRLITTLRVVPRGTNGGVSVIGTIASAIGGLLVGLAYYFTLVLMADVPLHRIPPQWPLVLAGTLAGLLGSAIDSVLGSTCQFSGYCRKQDKIVEVPGPNVKHISGIALLDNHSVNLLSSLLTAVLMPPIASSLLWPLFT